MGTRIVGATPPTLVAQSQDGEPIGQLQGVTVDASGLVKASFSNGTNQALGKIVLAQLLVVD